MVSAIDNGDIFYYKCSKLKLQIGIGATSTSNNDPSKMSIYIIKLNTTHRVAGNQMHHLKNVTSVIVKETLKFGLTSRL